MTRTNNNSQENILDSIVKSKSECIIDQLLLLGNKLNNKNQITDAEKAIAEIQSSQSDESEKSLKILAIDRLLMCNGKYKHVSNFLALFNKVLTQFSKYAFCLIDKLVKLLSDGLIDAINIYGKMPDETIDFLILEEVMMKLVFSSIASIQLMACITLPHYVSILDDSYKECLINILLQCMTAHGLNDIHMLSLVFGIVYSSLRAQVKVLHQLVEERELYRDIYIPIAPYLHASNIQKTEVDLLSFQLIEIEDALLKCISSTNLAYNFMEIAQLLTMWCVLTKLIGGFQNLDKSFADLIEPTLGYLYISPTTPEPECIQQVNYVYGQLFHQSTYEAELYLLRVCKKYYLNNPKYKMVIIGILSRQLHLSISESVKNEVIN